MNRDDKLSIFAGGVVILSFAFGFLANMLGMIGGLVLAFALFCTAFRNRPASARADKGE